MHNRYVAYLQSETTGLPLLHGKLLETCAGDWRQYFFAEYGLKAAQLIVEIGCYKGKNLTELALCHPRTAFIGIDCTFKRVVLTAKKLMHAGVRNAVVVLYDAHNLAQLFVNQRLDGMLCFFPDPWSKRKQSHNRLWSESFCADVANLLDDDACLWLKTDVESFYRQTEHNLAQAGLRPCRQSMFTHELESEFEMRYLKLQRPIYAGTFSRVRM